MNEENQQQEAEKEAVTVFDIEDQESSQSEVETASASNDDDSRSIDSAVVSINEIFDWQFEALDFAIATELTAGSTPTISCTLSKS